MFFVAKMLLCDVFMTVYAFNYESALRLGARTQMRFMEMISSRVFVIRLSKLCRVFRVVVFPTGPRHVLADALLGALQT